MNKKIIFFDIDGTLANGEGNIPQSTKKALQLLKERGHLSIICTGRTKVMLPKSIVEIGFDGYILGAGTQVEYQNKELFYHEMGSKEVQKTIEVMHDYNALFTLEGKDFLYVEEAAFSDERPYFSEFIKGMGNAVKLVNDSPLIQMSKLTCMIPTENREKIPEMVAAMQNLYQVILHENKGEKVLTDGLVELVPTHCDKATGIKQFLEHLNLSLEDTFAIGDSNNDLQMLTYANTSICMGNGCNQAKEVSDYVTSSIDEDGVYNGLKHFGLID